MLTAIDGAVKDATIDTFRIKIWNMAIGGKIYEGVLVKD